MPDERAKKLESEISHTPETASSRLMRFLPLAAIAISITVFFSFGLDRFLTFDALRENRIHLAEFVAARGVPAIALYIFIYALSVALSVPGAAVLTIAGGLLFGQWFGAFYVVVGATLGSMVVFFIARTTFGDALRKRAGPAMQKMEAGFQENALSYLLVLRLIPLFPFFLVNIVSALLGVNLRTYVIGTFVGIIPGSFVYASLGAGLGSIFERNEAFSLHGILTPEIKAALIGLAFLALVPVVFKKCFKNTT